MLSKILVSVMQKTASMKNRLSRIVKGQKNNADLPKAENVHASSQSYLHKIIACDVIWVFLVFHYFM